MMSGAAKERRSGRRQREAREPTWPRAPPRTNSIKTGAVPRTTAPPPVRLGERAGPAREPQVVQRQAAARRTSRGKRAGMRRRPLPPAGTARPHDGSDYGEERQRGRGALAHAQVRRGSPVPGCPPGGHRDRCVLFVDGRAVRWFLAGHRLGAPSLAARGRSCPALVCGAPPAVRTHVCGPSPGGPLSFLAIWVLARPCSECTVSCAIILPKMGEELRDMGEEKQDSFKCWPVFAAWSCSPDAVSNPLWLYGGVAPRVVIEARSWKRIR